MGSADSTASPARKSSLKDYGYDFVLATTQRSINATMKMYLDGLKQRPETKALYASDPDSMDVIKQQTPELISMDALTKRLQTKFPGKFPSGIDPLGLPDDLDTNDDRLNALADVGFEYGLHMVAGIPDHYESKAEIPDLIGLSKGASAVSFRMLCKNFDIVELKAMRRKIFWNVYSQSKSEHPWAFVAEVDLRTNTVGAGFANLPPDVREATKNLDDSMFSIQQLALDLSNTRLQKPAVIEGLDPGSPAYNSVQNHFATEYCQELAAHGKPILNYTVQHKAQTATLAPIALDYLVVPYLGDDSKDLPSPTSAQRGMATLNYLCVTKGSLPQTNKAFGWNWVAENEASQLDGLISINRNTFRDWFLSIIKPEAIKSCFAPGVNVTPGSWAPNFNYWRSPISESDLNISNPNTGSRVLEITYERQAEDGAGLDWALGSLRYKNSYSATVDFSQSTIKVVIHGIIWAQLKVGQSWQTANVVDKTWTSEWTLAATAKGGLEVKGEPVMKNDSQDDRINDFSNFFTGANKIFQDLRTNSLENVPFGPFPFRSLTGFVFPGGRAFAFKNLRFSENQDLLCAITYTDPTGS